MSFAPLFSRNRVKKLFASIPVFIILYFLNLTLKIRKPVDLSSNVGSRKLLKEEEEVGCIPQSMHDFPDDFFTQKERVEGGVVIHILICVYLIAALAIVCDEYFVAALEAICDKLNLTTDVAGATFMAAGSSAPEFFTSVIGVFVVESDVGVGTIVGSAVFNILAVTSVCGMVAKTAIPLDIWPVIRDCFAYFITVIALVLVMYDGLVIWYEGLILVILFFLYIALMYFNVPLDEMFSGKVKNWGWCRYSHPEDEEKAPLLTGENADEIKSKTLTESYNSYHSQSLIESAIVHEKVAERENAAQKDDGEGSAICSMPHKGIFKQIMWMLMWPVSLLLYFTIPDCRKKFWERFFMLTFILSIVWLGILSYLIVWMVTIIGYTFGIPDTVMGLTLLAVGTSLPEIVASVVVTREGLGNMAIGNNIGSNVFDILFCLGFPWFLKSVISSEDIVIQSGGLLYSTLMLVATLVVFLFALWMSSWKLNKTLGIGSAFLYLIFLTFAILYELNIFGQVNLPSCP